MANKGRPTKYSQKLADEICDRLSQGKSMRTVCRDDDMPAASTVFRWLREREDFQEQYARAKHEAADAIVEELFDIADDGANDYMDVWYGDKKVTKVDQEALGRSRLRVDTRKWYLSKIKPKKYGDHLNIDETSTVTHRFEDMDDEELDKAIEDAKDRIS